MPPFCEMSGLASDTLPRHQASRASSGRWFTGIWVSWELPFQPPIFKCEPDKSWPMQRRPVQCAERCRQSATRYRILYEPQRTFTLLVPGSGGPRRNQSAARGESLLLAGSGDELRQRSQPGSLSGDDFRRWRGTVELIVQYSLPMPTLDADKPRRALRAARDSNGRKLRPLLGDADSDLATRWRSSLPLRARPVSSPLPPRVPRRSWVSSRGCQCTFSGCARRTGAGSTFRSVGSGCKV
jgi:hypothetical protein